MRWSVTGEAVTVDGFDDETGGGHGREARVEGGGADAAGCPQFGERPWLLAVQEGGGDSVIDGGRLERSVGLAIGLNRFEGKSAVALDQFERDAWHGGSGTMLDGQDDTIVTVPPEIEVGIAPGVELRRSAQGLTGTNGARALFGVMDEHHGDGVAPLQFAQEGKQRRDIATDILIDAMQAHERIEDEQPRFQPGDGLFQTYAVSLEIEAQTGRRDHLDVEFGETDAGGGANAFEAATDDMERVLGGIEQHATGIGHDEAPQAGDAGGDGDREIEGKEGFAAFRLAADDADGLFRPQPVDEPALLFGALGETPGLAGPEAGSSPAPDRRLGLVRGGHGADFEEQRLVDLAGLALRCGGEKLVRHDHQGARIALGVIADRGDQLRRHQAGGTGLAQSMAQAVLEFLWRRAFDRHAHPHAAGQRQEFIGAQTFGQPPVACQHGGQQDLRVEFRRGQQAQFGEHGELHLLCLIDQKHRSGQGALDVCLPALA